MQILDSAFWYTKPDAEDAIKIIYDIFYILP